MKVRRGFLLADDLPPVARVHPLRPDLAERHSGPLRLRRIAALSLPCAFAPGAVDLGGIVLSARDHSSTADLHPS